MSVLSLTSPPTAIRLLVIIMTATMPMMVMMMMMMMMMTVVVVVVGMMTTIRETTIKLNTIFMDWIQLLFSLNTVMTIFHYDTLCLFLPHVLTAGRYFLQVTYPILFACLSYSSVLHSSVSSSSLPIIYSCILKFSFHKLF
jgi:hypothetical protein